jgi:hypothetical protein
MDEMPVGLGDMDEHSSQELQWVKELFVIDLVMKARIFIWAPQCRQVRGSTS